MIPKIIHQIWIGPKEPPTHWINTWKNIGFKYILWDEKKLSKLTMTNRDKFDYFMKKRVYYGASDIARLEILHQFGGLYIDADTERLKDLPNKWFDYSFFAVEAYPDPRWEYRITNGVLGSEKNSPIIKKYIDKIAVAKKIEPCWNTIGGTLLTEVIKDFKNDKSILLLDPYLFYPSSSKGIISPNANEAVAKHYWGSTHNLY